MGNQHDSLDADLEALRSQYTAALAEHGDSPQAVQWADRPSQERRMSVLLEVGDLSSAKILDLGCGTGHLLSFLRERLGFHGEYVGYDLSEEMVAVAQAKYPDARFESRNILETGLPEAFDYVLVNGTFNNLVSDNSHLATSLLRTLYAGTRRAIAFNMLSTYVDYQDEGLFYANPEAVFGFCKTELSPCVTLRHDYRVKPGVIPFEFTVYVVRDDGSELTLDTPMVDDSPTHDLT